MRTVLISGANRGLGLEFARQYLAAGDRVIAGVRDPANAKELNALPGREQLVVAALDVTDDASVKAFRHAVADEPIDILIANAGITGGEHQRRLGDLDYHRWLEAFAVNTLGPVRLAEAFVEQVASSRERKMIALSSLLGSTADTTGGAADLPLDQGRPEQRLAQPRARAEGPGDRLHRRPPGMGQDRHGRAPGAAGGRAVHRRPARPDRPLDPGGHAARS